jgi:hypothetical protein
MPVAVSRAVWIELLQFGVNRAALTNALDFAADDLLDLAIGSGAVIQWNQFD